MTVTPSKLLFLIATILFAVALILVMFTDHNGQAIADLFYGGLTATAAGLLLG